jgi:tetratricopeptide (TPR) repeat protein
LAVTLFCSTFFALWLAAAAGTVQRIDQTALRSLAEFPHLNVEQGYIFRAIPFRGEGEYLMGPLSVVDAPSKVDRAAVARLRGTLKNDLTDAPRYAELADMYEDLGEDAKPFRQKAVELFRSSLKQSRSINVPRFASVLVRLENQEEAERLLTNAVMKNASWRESAQLSFLEIDLVIEDLGMTNTSINLMNYPDALAKRLRANPSETQLAHARARLERSKRAAEQAVASASDEPKVYIFQATILMLHRRLDWLLPALDASAAAAANDEVVNAIADCIEHVAKLQPNDPVPSATVAYYLVGQAGASVWDPVDGYRLPPKQKNQVENALAELEALSKSTTATTAAASLSALAYFDFLFKNNPWGAEQKFRRALELDPASQEGWQGLCGVLGVTGRFSKLKTLAEERLKLQETPATYILLGKSCAKLKERDESESAVKKALALDPADPLANLALAALLLSEPEKSSSAEISRMLDRVESKRSKLSDAQQVDLDFIRGIELALDGKIDEARGKWRDVLKHDAGNEAAKRALRFIDEAN